LLFEGKQENFVYRGHISRIVSVSVAQRRFTSERTLKKEGGFFIVNNALGHPKILHKAMRMMEIFLLPPSQYNIYLTTHISECNR
jgi:hypothetical protein